MSISERSLWDGYLFHQFLSGIVDCVVPFDLVHSLVPLNIRPSSFISMSHSESSESLPLEYLCLLLRHFNMDTTDESSCLAWSELYIVIFVLYPMCRLSRKCLSCNTYSPCYHAFFARATMCCAIFTVIMVGRLFSLFPLLFPVRSFCILSLVYYTGIIFFRWHQVSLDKLYLINFGIQVYRIVSEPTYEFLKLIFLRCGYHS